MRKEFIPYEKALALKELGFDEKCLAYWFNETPSNPEGQCIVYYEKPYDNQKITNGVIKEYCLAPLFQQAFEFFEEKFGLYCEIQIDKTTEPKWCFTISKFIGNPNDLSGEEWGWENVPVDNWYLYRTRREAQLVLIDSLIKIVKKLI